MAEMAVSGSLIAEQSQPFACKICRRGF